MRKFLWLTLMVSVLILFGCDSADQPKTQSAPKAKQPTVKEKAQATTKTKTVIPAVAAAQAVAEEAQEKVDQTAKIAEDIVQETSESVVTKVTTTVKTTEEAVSKAVTPVIKPEAGAGAPAAKPGLPQEITLSASYGNVTFPHGLHAEDINCSICHEEGTPAGFDITKEVAHKLCKGCHKEEGAGPTGCKGCHIK